MELNFPNACIHELFAEQAALRPAFDAVVYGTERLTYRDLDLRSNQLAHFLMARGIEAGDRVAIFMNRSTDMIVAMLGILKAGATYLPIDTQYPAERVRFLAEDAQIKLVLTKSDTAKFFSGEAPLIAVNDPEMRIASCSTEALINRSNPESIALLSYTSGSTGQPKAARIPHRGIVRAVRATNYIEISPEDRISQTGSPSFDAAILEIWLALANGAAVVGIPKEALLNLAELPRVLQETNVSILLLNTSYVHQIGRDQPAVLKGIRKVIFGGEAAEAEPLRPLLKELGPGVLLNTYGPAEGSVITTYHEISEIPEGTASISIGRPVSSTQVYLLDEAFQPVPVGTQGEIYIGGAGVACGYFNKPQLTSDRFLPDVFGGRPEQVLYRTGDFARMRIDGELEFVGRIDEQVKIRGHRIELAEVRHALATHPNVKQQFLMVREDTPGDKRLVAYVVLRDSSESAIIQDSLRQHAAAALPADMVPAAFLVVDAIPLNINGKVDRQALPMPSLRPDFTAGYKAPRTDLEIKLAAIWRDLLRVEKVGIDDSFFDLGGHSLVAARLISRMEKQLGLNIPLATLFEAPTIGQLVLRLNERSYERSWSPLVELFVPDRTSTAKPFFCVHSLGANLVNFHKVAKHLGGDRPIYGLQPHGLDGQQEPLTSIESIASAYVKEIRKKQPNGPFLLGGVCLGGVIAYEIAQQLRASGETVALVALIDSYAPGKYQNLRSRHALSEYLDRHLGDILALPYLSRIPYLTRWAANGFIQLGRALGLRDRSSLAEATRRVSRAHRRAFFAYKPKPYADKVVQFLCGDAAHRSYEDRRLAWSSLAMSGFEVRLIPGNHHTMIEEPHAQVLARELKPYLEKAHAAKSAIPLRVDQEQLANSYKRSYAVLPETMVS